MPLGSAVDSTELMVYSNSSLAPCCVTYSVPSSIQCPFFTAAKKADNLRMAVKNRCSAEHMSRVNRLDKESEWCQCSSCLRDEMT